MSSILAPRHGYNVRHFPTRRHSTDSSTLHLSSLSNNSALSLIRQRAQPFSLDSTTTNSLDVVPQYFTSGLDTASLLSSDVQTAYISGYLFSEVLIPTPVPTHKRRPEYFTSQPSDLLLQTVLTSQWVLTAQLYTNLNLILDLFFSRNASLITTILFN